MKRNYHTHCELCGHAIGSLEDYVKEAIKDDFRVLGISDHVPLPDDSIYARMPYKSLAYYCDEIDALKEKYSEDIKLYRGFECEYFPKWVPFYEKLLEDNKAEYLIMGQHYIEREKGELIDAFFDLNGSEDAITYANAAMEGMRTGLFAYLAHPDLFMIGDFKADRNTDEACDIILDEAVKHDYILELNANGLRHEHQAYPSLYFWEKAAKTNVRVILGADAHRPDALADEQIIRCKEIAKELNLKLLDRLPFDHFESEIEI